MPVTQAYGIAVWASDAEREVVCQAALRVLWRDLEWFDIDLAGLSEDAQTTAAVRTLEGFRTRALLTDRSAQPLT